MLTIQTILRSLVAIAIAIAVLFLVWYFSNIVVYILVSAVLAIIGKPLAELYMKPKIRGVGLPKIVVAALTLLTIWAVAIAFFAIFIPLIVSNLNQLANINLSTSLEAFKEPLASLQSFVHDMLPEGQNKISLSDAIRNQFAPLVDFAKINNFFSSIVGTISSFVIALFSISFITFFFIKEDQLFYQIISGMAPSKYEESVTKSLDSITELLKRYFIGILTESTIVMLIISIILIVAGQKAETAFFIGLIVGVLNVVPYIGPLIGAGIGFVIAVLNPIAGVAVLTTGLITVCTVLFTQGVDNFVLQPVLYSNSVKAHPLEIFIVILIAGSVAGILGMLLAIPAYNVIRVFAKEFFSEIKVVRTLTDKI